MARYLPTPDGQILVTSSGDGFVVGREFAGELLADLRRWQSEARLGLAAAYRDWANDLEAAITAAEGVPCLSTTQNRKTA